MKGAFFNYVDKVLAFLDHLHTPAWYLWRNSFTATFRGNLHTCYRHFKYHLPTSSCQHSLWMPPNGDSLYYLTIIWGIHRRLQIIEIQKSRMFCGKLVSEPNNLSQIFGNCWQNSDYPGLRVGGKLDFVFISQYVYLKITI